MGSKALGDTIQVRNCIIEGGGRPAGRPAGQPTGPRRPPAAGRRPLAAGRRPPAGRLAGRLAGWLAAGWLAAGCQISEKSLKKSLKNL